MRVKAATGSDRADMVDFVNWQMPIGNGLDEVGIPSDSVELPLNMISPTHDDLIATFFQTQKILEMTAQSLLLGTSTATR
jgi:hypothetical protein